MATAARDMRRIKPRSHRRKVSLVVIHGSRELATEQGNALVASMSERFRARQDQQRLERAEVIRRAHYVDLQYERDSVIRAVMAVEHRLVEALWVLARLPSQGARGFSSRNGIPYMLDRVDQYANAVANGGWDTPAPRPAVPSAKSIDAMYDPLTWLSWLGRIEGKLVAAAASSKRGQMKANIRWRFVREQVPELADIPTRTLQHRYHAALRDLVAELTFRKASHALA
jgi:hypothetical protein